MIYRDRMEAARSLAARLAPYKGRRPLVLAIPRGAVPMAEALARALDADLDVVLVRKLGMPGQEEFALGAVDEAGQAWYPTPPERYGVDQGSLEPLIRSELARIRGRRASYTPKRRPIDPRGRVVIVVDDGAATGSTMVVALDAVRRLGAAKVVAAVPVASVDAARLIRQHADEAVILQEPQPFYAVGLFYEDFGEVADQEVVDILSRHSPAP